MKTTIETLVMRARMNLFDAPMAAREASIESASSAATPYLWDKTAFEQALDVTVPRDLDSLWKCTSELRIHEDLTLWSMGSYRVGTRPRDGAAGTEERTPG